MIIVFFNVNKYFLQKVSKYKIRPPVTIFSVFLKKYETTKSIASPEPNGFGEIQQRYWADTARTYLQVPLQH